MAKITEVIAYLDEVKGIHGDLDVFRYGGDIAYEVPIDLEASDVCEQEVGGEAGLVWIPKMPKRVIL